MYRRRNCNYLKTDTDNPIIKWIDKYWIGGKNLNEDGQTDSDIRRL